MKFIIRLLLTGMFVVILAWLLPGVSVENYWTAVIVALVLAILNFLVKPILILLTLPVTILTLGLFLLVINAIIIFIADGFVEGFNVDGWFMAIIFSLLLSLFQSIVYSASKAD
ncbi:hypothetical protein C7S20_08760 [Christiangramia fulva]|uniref:Phage holin family protein n=1 Tax=Christiangramia fulva TaxID=2126553 RepID=A0A2R3Z511_9FLAO|nr:phage holin family protein [Christiangramia fulva]AVR45351.1 hypothetical protein C7S20_08760 [Christiangramia fulva]